MTTQTNPTIVFVHGAFADSASFNGVIGNLLAQGYPCIANSCPLRGVKNDAEDLSNLLASIQRPVVLVGHSYGGMVISNVSNSNVKALVFISGLAPDVGENASDLVGLFPGSTLGPTLYSVPLPDGDNDLYIQQDKFWAQFAADVPEAQAKLMGATQRPIKAAAFSEASAGASWKTLPSWFILGELDKNIPPAVHHFLADRAKAVQTIEVKGSSHVVMVSHPDVASDVIVTAAQGILVEE